MTIDFKTFPWWVLFTYPKFESAVSPEDRERWGASMPFDTYDDDEEVDNSHPLPLIDSIADCEVSGMWVAGLAMVAAGDLAAAHSIFLSALGWRHDYMQDDRHYMWTLNYIILTEILLGDFEAAEMHLAQYVALTEAHRGHPWNTFRPLIVHREMLLWIVSNGEHGKLASFEEIDEAKKVAARWNGPAGYGSLESIAGYRSLQDGNFKDAASRFLNAAAVRDCSIRSRDGFFLLTLAAHCLVIAGCTSKAKIVYQTLLARLDDSPELEIRCQIVDEARSLGVEMSPEQRVRMMKPPLDDVLV